jgi:hypothetical protein
MLTNRAISGFGTVITESFGFSEFNSTLLIGVVGLMGFFANLGCG